MAALTKDRETESKEPIFRAYPMAAVKIFKGSLVAINAAGFVAPAADTANFRVVGVADELVDNSAGAAGDKKIRVIHGRAFRFAATAITQAMVGQTMYVVDDQTVDDAIGTNAIQAGVLVEFISATEGWIFIPQGGMGIGTALADADLTYSQNEVDLINQLKARLNTYGR